MKHIELVFVWLGSIFGVFTVVTHAIEQLNDTKCLILGIGHQAPATPDQTSLLLYSDWLPLWGMTLFGLGVWVAFLMAVPRLHLMISDDEDERFPTTLRVVCYATATLPFCALAVLLVTGVWFDIPAMKSQL